MADHSNPTLRRAASLRLFGLFIFCCLFPPHFIGTFFFLLYVQLRKVHLGTKRKRTPKTERRRNVHRFTAVEFYTRMNQINIFRESVSFVSVQRCGWVVYLAKVGESVACSNSIGNLIASADVNSPLIGERNR